MFLTNKYSGYTRDGAQFAQGYFLILATNEEEPPYQLRPPLLYCIRFVRYTQCGHFMMGYARIAGQSVILSGPYGSDSLPVDLGLNKASDRSGKLHPLSEATIAKFKPVPQEIADLYWSQQHDENAEAIRK